MSDRGAVRSISTPAQPPPEHGSAGKQRACVTAAPETSRNSPTTLTSWRGSPDFNGDGIGDIATSATTAYVSGHKGAGQVIALYGSATGVTTAKRTTLSQNSTGVPGTSEKGDNFGWEIDLGDINGDGCADLVVSAPYEDIGSNADTGQVTVLYGSKTGIDLASGAQSFAQSTAGVPGDDEKNDLFGADVKLDDVTGDGKADLVVGSYENGGDGAVTYLPSNGSKITTTGSRALPASKLGVSTTGQPQLGAVFGD